MAITYDIYLAPAQDGGGTEWQARALAIVEEGEGSCPSGLLELHYDAPGDVVRRFVFQDFGVSPALWVGVRLDKFRLLEAELALADFVADIMRSLDGTVLVLFNGESVVCLRHAEALDFDKSFKLGALLSSSRIHSPPFPAP